MGTQYNGLSDLVLKRVWYGGTTTLLPGMAVSYDVDDTNAPVSSTTVPTHDIRGQRVVDPATANLGAFAGVVSAPPQIAGTPGWIDIIVPRKGDVLKLFTKINATKLTSTVGITNAGGVNFVSVTDATINIDLVANALETLDTSTTAALTLCRFM